MDNSNSPPDISSTSEDSVDSEQEIKDDDIPF